MSDASSKTLWPTAIAVLGVFAIFLLIMRVARTPVEALDAPANVTAEEQWRYSPEGRKSRLQELRGREATAREGYAWIDQNTGVVRLPLDRAIELTIADANAQR